MGWDELTAKVDIAIFILLVIWFSMDRLQVYFRNPK